jgi:hypothetical protein
MSKNQHSGEMSKNQHSVVTAAPVERVFAFAADLEKTLGGEQRYSG